MNSEFDPYSSWLGIESEKRPPNHYELLGLTLFEARADLIDEHSVQRFELLQDIATGSTQVELSQRILNEVSAARICLLDRQQRELYDFALKKKQVGLVSAEERIIQHVGEEQPNEDANPHPNNPVLPMAILLEKTKSFTPSQRTPSQRTPSNRTPSNRTPSNRTPSNRTPSNRTPSSPKKTIVKRRRRRPWALPVFGMVVPLLIAIGILIGVFKSINPGSNRPSEPALASQLDPMRLVDVNDPRERNQFSTPRTPRTTRDASNGRLSAGAAVNKSKKTTKPVAKKPAKAKPDKSPDKSPAKPPPKSPDKSPAKPPAKSADKSPAKPAAKKAGRIIAKYDASLGLGEPKRNNPKKTIQSPTQQGWTANSNRHSSDINEGVYGQYVAWKNGDEFFDEVDFRINLSEKDLEEMWLNGWRLEVIARPVKSAYAIGWGPNLDSKFFKMEAPSQAKIVFQKTEKSSFHVRTGTGPDQKPVLVKSGFAKVVLVGKPKSNDFTVTVFQWKNNPIELATHTVPFWKGRNFAGQIGWSTTNSAKNLRKSIASIEVHKIQLSILAKPPK